MLVPLQCAVCSACVQCLCAMCSVQCAVCSVQCAVCNVRCAVSVCSVQLVCAVCTVQHVVDALMRRVQTLISIKKIEGGSKSFIASPLGRHNS